VVSMKQSNILVFVMIFALSALAFSAGTGVNLTVTSGCSSNVNGNLTVSNDINATGTCFIITGNNVVLDCDGYTITGDTTGYGIVASGRTGLEVKNCIISNFSDDIRTENSSNNAWFHNNTLKNAGNSGVSILTATGNNVSNNSFIDNAIGAVFNNMDSSVFSLNLISNAASYSMQLDNGSTGNTVTYNTISSAGEIDLLAGSNSNLVSGNALSGGVQITSDNSNSNNYTDNNITSGVTYGIYLYQSNYSLVDSCILTGAGTANIFLQDGSNYNVIRNTNASDSPGGAILSGSNYNNITNVTACGYGSEISQGVILQGSSNDNIVENSTFCNASNHGVNAEGSRNTIRYNQIYDSTGGNDALKSAGLNASIYDNSIWNWSKGVYIYVYSGDANGTLLENNTIENITGGDGIYLESVSEITLRHNTVTNTSAKGIYLNTVSSCVLFNNSAASAGTSGIALLGSTNNNLTDNTLSDMPNYYALDIEGASTGNRIYGLTGTGLGTDPTPVSGDIGICDYQSGGNSYENISIQGGGVSGFYTDQAPNGVVQNMNITGFAYGLDVEGGDGGVYNNIRVTNSTTSCAYVWTAQNTVISNSVFDCPDATNGIEIDFFDSYPSANGTQILGSNITAGSPINSDRASYNLISNNRLLVTSSSGTVSLSMPATGGGGGGPLIPSHSNITNNTVVCVATGGCTGAGITLMDDDNLVYNNSIYNFTDGTAGSAGTGILLDNNAELSYDNNVSGNYVYNCSYGIYLNCQNKGDPRNNTISNNQVELSGTYGIQVNSLGGTLPNIVEANSITDSGAEAAAIACAQCDADIIRNNYVNSSGYGIIIGVASGGSSNCNVTGNNVSYITNETYGAGIRVREGSGNRIDNNRLTDSVFGMQFLYGPNTADSNYIASNDYGVHFGYDGGKNNLSNSTITGSANFDILSNESAEDTLINTTFDKGKVSFPMSDDSNVTVMWYVRANVTNWAGTAITGANVTITDVNGAVVLSEITASPTSFSEFTEYIANVTENVSFNNYTANVTKAQDCGNRFNVTEQNLTASTTWEITLDNAAPTIDAVYSKSAEDPLSCANTTIGAVQFNVTDPNGACEINTSATYVDINKGAASRFALTCVNASQTGNNTLTISCTGADLYYWDSPGSWTLGVYAEDNYAGTDTDSSGTMTYNEGIYLTVNDGPINFGNVAKGTSDNLNLNLPATNLENCGNVVLNDTITGANISDTSGDYWIPVSMFKANDVSSTGGAITLTEAAQEFQPIGGITVSTGPASTWDTYYFVTIPTTQYATTYANGTWTFTPSKA